MSGKKRRLYAPGSDKILRLRAAASSRVTRMEDKLASRDASICAANNPRKRGPALSMPSALEHPGPYQFYAYELGSHSFEWLEQMWHRSRGRCGCVGIDGDPNSTAHLCMGFKDFYLHHMEDAFGRCPPGAIVLSGNCASDSQQAVALHGKNWEVVNGAPSTHEMAQKIEF